MIDINDAELNEAVEALARRLVSASPKQKQFFKSKHKYTCYGGARGGGKSWALDQAVEYFGLYHPGIRMLLVRKTYADLEENHIRILKKDLDGIAHYDKQQHLFTFYNGSTLKLGYFSSDADEDQYQGREYDIIFIEEATQFLKRQYDVLTACLRGVNEHPKQIFLTCNPKQKNK